MRKFKYPIIIIVKLNQNQKNLNHHYRELQENNIEETKNQSLVFFILNANLHQFHLLHTHFIDCWKILEHWLVPCAIYILIKWCLFRFLISIRSSSQNEIAKCVLNSCLLILKMSNRNLRRGRTLTHECAHTYVGICICTYRQREN